MLQAVTSGLLALASVFAASFQQAAGVPVLHVLRIALRRASGDVAPTGGFRF